MRVFTKVGGKIYAKKKRNSYSCIQTGNGRKEKKKKIMIQDYEIMAPVARDG